jgi:hypothetical protein
MVSSGKYDFTTQTFANQGCPGFPTPPSAYVVDTMGLGLCPRTGGSSGIELATRAIY